MRRRLSPSRLNAEPIRSWKNDGVELQNKLTNGGSLLGPGWQCVNSFDDIEDDEYEEEEEEYVIMDLGTAMDSKTLQTEATYQLTGMDTPMPFLKIGDHVFQGTVSELLGDEVIFEVVRQEDDPQHPNYRPAYKTRNHIEMRGVTLKNRTYVPPPSTAQNARMNGAGYATEAPTTEEPVAAAPSSPVVSFAPETTPIPDVGPSRLRDATPAQHSAPASPTVALTPDISTSAAAESSTRRRSGRPRGSITRAGISVRTLQDLADIHHAGGLGDVRLEIASDATPELLQAVEAVRNGRPWKAGDKLSRPQEDRLIHGRPATGRGSRGGRTNLATAGTTRTGRGRGRGRGARGGRGGRRSGAAGDGDVFVSVEDFIGVDESRESTPAAAGPSASANRALESDGDAVMGRMEDDEPLMSIDDDEPLREIGE